MFVRSLRSLPAPELLARLEADQGLRRQAEHLNAARYAADVVTRIRWVYQVLEQEKIRKPAFAIRDDFRHLRNAVSHPQLTDQNAKAYFLSIIGAEMPDLQNEKHLDFLASEAQKLLEEATKIVETTLSDHRFWN